MFGTFFRQVDRRKEETMRLWFDQFHDRVYRTAYFIIKDRYLAQDVLQETFLKAYRHIDNVQDSRKVGAWLTTITSNAAIDLLRKQNRWNGIPAEDVLLVNDSDSPLGENIVEVEVERLIESDLIRRQLDRLKSKYKQALLPKYFEGLKDEEIASLLGISVGAVKSRMHRARQQLRALVEAAERESGVEEVVP